MGWSVDCGKAYGKVLVSGLGLGYGVREELEQ